MPIRFDWPCISVLYAAEYEKGYTAYLERNKALALEATIPISRRRGLFLFKHSGQSLQKLALLAKLSTFVR